ncbi:MAG: 4Fe-4S dicluster domain-containing protein [Promethearchaeota archaeon]
MQVVDFTFRDQFYGGSRTLNYCYQCATCSGGCPVALKTGGEYNPRKIVELSLMGLKERIVRDRDPDPWLCTTCQKCVEFCPQGVQLTEIFTTLKNLCALEGVVPEAFLSQAETIFNTSLAIPLTPPITRRRNQLGLPELRVADPSEVQQLLSGTSLKTILETRAVDESQEGA